MNAFRISVALYTANWQNIIPQISERNGWIVTEYKFHTGKFCGNTRHDSVIAEDLKQTYTMCRHPTKFSYDFFHISICYYCFQNVHIVKRNSIFEMIPCFRFYFRDRRKLYCRNTKNFSLQNYFLYNHMWCNGSNLFLFTMDNHT